MSVVYGQGNSVIWEKPTNSGFMAKTLIAHQYFINLAFCISFFMLAFTFLEAQLRLYITIPHHL